MALILLTLTFIFNIGYLVCVWMFTASLEKYCFDYWVRIGRPRNFSGNHAWAILSRLYRSEMSYRCNHDGTKMLLKLIRILFPVAFIISAVTLLYFAY